MDSKKYWLHFPLAILTLATIVVIMPVSMTFWQSS